MDRIYSAAEVVYVHPGVKFLQFDNMASGQLEIDYRHSDISDIRMFVRPVGLKESPWLHRTWVMQEVMLAKKLYIFVEGSRVVNSQYLSFRTRIPVILRKRLELHDEYAKESVFHGGVNLRWWRVHDLLSNSREFSCQDARDKIFALLSMFQRPIPTLLFPDYTKSVRKVYSDASWFMVNYDIPESLSLAGVEQAAGEMLSWITNWSYKPALRALEEDLNSAHWRAGFAPDLRQIRASRKHDDILTVRGVLVDRVRFLHLGQVSDLKYHFWKVNVLVKHSTLEGEGGAARELESNARDEPLGRLFHTKMGRCLGPSSVQVGDHVCILLGCKTPFVIRQTGNDWILVGQCYVRGLMDGQFADTLDWTVADADPPVEPFVDFRFH